jgi:hypothetical protein
LEQEVREVHLFLIEDLMESILHLALLLLLAVVAEVAMRIAELALVLQVAQVVVVDSALAVQTASLVDLERLAKATLVEMVQ